MTERPESTADLSAEKRRQLLAKIGHELRTSVNHIVGYNELLQNEAENRGATELISDLQGIQIEGQRLLSLVLDTLESAKVEPAESLDRLQREVRVPLRTIMGYSEMLKVDAVKSNHDDLVPDLERVSAAARNWLTFVNADRVGSADDVSKLHLPQVSRARERARTSAPQSRRPAGSRAASLLVVDDNETNRDLLSRSLERQGSSVQVAENGMQALDMVRSEDFDLVLLDVLMPEMDGLEVLRELKADESSRDVPVIVLSSLDDTDGVERSFELGADDYIPKPFDSGLLRIRITASLKKGASRSRPSR